MERATVTERRNLIRQALRIVIAPAVRPACPKFRPKRFAIEGDRHANSCGVTYIKISSSVNGEDGARDSRGWVGQFVRSPSYARQCSGTSSGN
jgi:hypothetical protein